MQDKTSYILTIDQVANGNPNNTASRDGGMGPIIDADGWFDLRGAAKRFDLLLTATDVTTGFNVQVYAKKIGGAAHPIGDPISFSSNGSETVFQDPVTFTHIKPMMADRTDGTLNAEIHLLS